MAAVSLDATALPFEPAASRVLAVYAAGGMQTAAAYGRLGPHWYYTPPPPVPSVCAGGVAYGARSLVPFGVPCAPHAGWAVQPLPPPQHGWVPMGVPIFPQAGWVHPLPATALPMAPVNLCVVSAPAPAPVTRCRITEIVSDGSSDESPRRDADDEPSPRSVLAPRRKAAVPRPKTTRRRVALPPPPPPPTTTTTRKLHRRKFGTSLMIKNIPNKFHKSRVMAILDQHCADVNAELDPDAVKSEYDFLYVPIDFMTNCNKGYAFVNMTTKAAARRLRDFLQGHSWDAASSPKVCAVEPADIEGRDALVAHFSGSSFPCRVRSFLPVSYEPPRDGVRETKEHVVGRHL